MNNDIAIKVENLTKIYHLYDKPQDRLKEALNPFKKSYHNDFYAINNISFEVKKGEIVGIIGKNGAGKSTLLKMITGVLTPTSGSIEVNGKIASLLELGAGFNPEMTGLENIYLNGTLMGFTHEEIDSKVDAILEFADIGDFIDQQVKTYSSGMFARLAFSVAINVEPDILIIDEALSVGDIHFQQKCIRKMDEFGASSKAILFVSHDIGIINKFCNQTLWIDNGLVKSKGDTNTITNRYFLSMSYDSQSQCTTLQDLTNTDKEKSKVGRIKWIKINDSFSSFGNRSVIITDIALYSRDNQKYTTFLSPNENITLFIKYKTYKNIENPILGFIIKDRLGMDITGSNTLIHKDVEFSNFHKNDVKIIKFSFKLPYLMTGKYSISPAIADGDKYNHIQLHWVNDAIFFDIGETLKYIGLGWYFGLDAISIKEDSLND